MSYSFNYSSNGMSGGAIAASFLFGLAFYVVYVIGLWKMFV